MYFIFQILNFECKDVVLEDMCKVVDTSPPGNMHKRKWLRNVFTEPLGELGVCTEEDKDKPLQTQATACTLLDTTENTDINIDESDSVSSDPDDESSTRAFVPSGGILKFLVTLFFILS